MIIAGGRRFRQAAGVAVELIDPALAHRVHVASYGNDGAIGTPAHPYKTPNAARDAMRAILPSQSRDAEVRIIDNVKGTLSLTAEDSGQNGFKVSWTGGDTLKPDVQGSLDNRNVITGWTQFDTGIWVASYDGPFTRSIWINNERAGRCRRGSGFTGATWTDTGYTAPEDAICTDDNAGDVILIYNDPQINFNEPHNRVVSVAGDAISMVYAAHQYLTVFPGLSRIGWPTYTTETMPFDIEGCWADFIANNAQGSFYYDRQDSKIYYIPRDGEDLATAIVTAPAIEEELVSIDGASDITVARLAVYGSNYSVAEGHAERASGFVYNNANAPSAGGGGNYGPDGGITTMVPAPAAIRVSNCTRVNLTEFRAQHHESMGVFHYGNLDCTIDRFLIEDCGGNGIAVGDMSELNSTTCSDGTLIDNGVVRRIGVTYKGSIGVRGAIATRSTFQRLLVYDVPYIAVMLSFGIITNPAWTEKIENCLIRRCHVYNAISVMGDGGAIYTANDQNGLIIEENYVHDIRNGSTAVSPVGAYYVDGEANRITVRNNVGIDTRDVLIMNEHHNPNTNVVINTYSNSSRVFQNGTQPQSYADPIIVDPATDEQTQQIIANAGPSSDIIIIYGISL